MNDITVKTLKQGYGIAIDHFGTKVEFPLSDLETMIGSWGVKKIYANFDGKRIKRAK